ncbi:class I adenylate-forming enzyme family protein [Pigmentiphaga litoralis]|uniref:class I adenylate-forming enzyme family protein n=1 Tax=Pigmentiphaga litoralis TaxID=516702 RepID=UPI003B42DC9C
MNVGSILRRCAQQWPGQIAVIDADSGRELPIGAFTSLAFGLGASLCEQGYAFQDRVAILGDNTPDYLLWDYGLMSAGLVRVPLDPSLSLDEQAAQLRDAGAGLLAYGQDHAERATGLQAAVPELRIVPLEVDVATAPRRVEPWAQPAPDAMASLNYTGGTTGVPKAVIITHGSLTSALHNIVTGRGQGPGDVMLNMRPIWPIAAIVVFAQIAAGGTVVLAGRFQPQRFLDLLQQYQAASTSLVPTHLVRLLKDTRPQDADLSALRTIDVGAAAIPPDVFLAAIEAFGPRIGIIYGLTEASWSCYQSPDALRDPATREARIRTAGRPLFGCEVRIDGKDGSAAPDVEGEVWIRGAHLAAGYWGKPELTAQTFQDGWFRSGDLGMLDETGVLRITGRLKEVIRTGGKSVLPDEVERAVCSYPGVADAAAAGLPDPEWGERIGVLVVLEAGADVDAERLLAHCGAVLSGFKKPRVVRFADSIPKSHYGKIQRAKVRQMLLDQD